MKIRMLLISVLVVAAAMVQDTPAQQARITSSELTREREQDGFNGAVRRVKVESAKITVREGKLVEGPRMVRAITTYDINGKRIDSVAHPVDANTPSGREQYRYDNKGNLIEMVLRGPDGSILSRESYQYEFDEVGNWKKMTTSIATYEDGKLSYEPIEITYRTITYYYNQTIEALTSSSQNKPSTVRLTSQSSVPNAVAAKPANESAVGNLTEVGNTRQGGAVAETNAQLTPKTPTVKRVTEDVLRAAAINLPAAVMPAVAQNRSLFRRVEVRVVINEKGEVTSAKANSPDQIFNDAAETAALKAKFSPDKLSTDPGQVFGVISYEFASAPTTSTPAIADKKTEVSKPKEANVPAKVQPAPPASTSSTSPNPVTANSTPTTTTSEEPPDLFTQGLIHLKAGQYSEAETKLKQFVFKYPEDPIGYSRLGYAYYGQKKYVEAVAALKMAIKIRPDLTDAQTYYILGVSYNALKKYSDAAKALKQGILVLRATQADAGESPKQGATSFFLLHYHLGLSYQSMGDNTSAIKEFEQAANLDPQSGEPHYGLAMVYIVMGDRKSTEKQVTILKTLNPDLAKRVSDFLATHSLFIPPGCLSLPCPNQ